MKKTIVIIILVIVAIIIIAIVPKKSADQSNVPMQPEISDLAPQAGLPASVEAKRQAIYAAAKTRTYDAIVALATEGQFRYTFGDGYEGGFGAWLRYIDSVQTKDNAFDTITELLKLPYGYQGDGIDIYTWPSFFLKSSDEWTADDIALMKTIMTDEEIEGFRQAGAYIGYRIGIKGDGTWVYYLAGD